ncbi:MAG: sigma factor-like helix-turn-helix DNA-binding protein [Eubacteriales bacterium]
MNWICYFEKYNSDRKLLDAIELEIFRLERQGSKSERLSKLRRTAESLRACILRVEELLDGYVSAAKTPKEASLRAQEQLFLCLRYQQEMTMEQTAEAMDVSRDTAYRIRKRILSRGDIFASTLSR